MMPAREPLRPPRMDDRRARRAPAWPHRPAEDRHVGTGSRRSWEVQQVWVVLVPYQQRRFGRLAISTRHYDSGCRPDDVATEPGSIADRADSP